jgi:hypothetical protein
MKGFSSGLEKATDNTYLHVVAEISMTGGKQPKQVFLSIKFAENKHLGWFNQLATFEESSQKFLATIEFNLLPNFVHGSYEVQLTALDPSAVFEKPSDITWKLGSVDVWFREGQSITSFVRKTESTKYYTKDPIIAQFPPKANENKNPVIALAVAGSIAFVFLLYVQRQAVHFNFKRLDFWGTMLVVSLTALTDSDQHWRFAGIDPCFLVWRATHRHALDSRVLRTSCNVPLQQGFARPGELRSGMTNYLQQ